MNISYSVKLSEFAGTEPVTLSEVKAQLKLDTSADDTLITALITQARMQMEAFTGTSIVEHDIEVIAKLDGCNLFELPYGPLSDIPDLVIQELKVLGGTATTLTSTQYDLYGGHFAQLRSPYDGMYSMTYTAGYDPLPQPLRLSIIHQAAYLYEHRGDEGMIDKISPTALGLAKLYRRVVA